MPDGARHSSSGSSELLADRTYDRHCVLVLGMHRSGTSALTRVLGLLGATLPRHIMGPGTGNETGHWEPERLVDLHDRLLQDAQSGWDDWRRLDLARLPLCQRDRYIREIADLITAEYDGSDLFVLKDPRICRFTPLMIDALQLIGAKTRAVISYRNPLEVVSSLKTRSGRMDSARASGVLLWLRHVLDAEHETRGLPRVFVRYDRFLKDWRQTMSHVVDGLGLHWPYTVNDIGTAVEDFLTPSLRHHASTTEDVVLDPALSRWAGGALQALDVLHDNPASAAARATLDRIRGELDAASPMLQLLQSESEATVEICRTAQRTAETYRDEALLQANADIAALHCTVAELTAARADAVRQSNALKDELNRNRAAQRVGEAEVAQLRDWCRAYQTSTSWRLTVPLRWAARMLRSLIGLASARRRSRQPLSVVERTEIKPT